MVTSYLTLFPLREFIKGLVFPFQSGRGSLIALTNENGTNDDMVQVSKLKPHKAGSFHFLSFVVLTLGA